MARYTDFLILKYHCHYLAKKAPKLNCLVWVGNFNRGIWVNSVNDFQLNSVLIHVKKLQGMEWFWFMWYGDFYRQIQVLLTNSVCGLYTCSAESQQFGELTWFLRNCVCFNLCTLLWLCMFLVYKTLSFDWCICQYYIATEVIFLLMQNLQYVCPVNNNATTCHLNLDEEGDTLEENMII